ncbi:probable 2-ketogluconate reductase [Porites lutea]|uniref:probable 2-ketogluconate reductase n=1 Tax=Porites lutea TaxID=51062 RepID=UPI003CC51288
MASSPVVLCYSSFNPPRPAFDVLFELAPAYESDFTLLDLVAVADLKEDERAKIEGIICTGGYGRTDHKLGKEIMDLLPNLKVISTPSTGINHIDVQAATDRGVRVGRSPGHFQSDSVAEFAFGLLLASARSIVLANEVARTTVFSSGQQKIGVFSPIQQVTGSTLGIIGFGNIGRAVAAKAKGFNMKILYYSRTRKEDQEKCLGVSFCPDLKKLLQESDFVILCLPYTDQTKHIISSKELCLMKPTATLINVGRGGTINHDDLTAALHNGVIRGVALDVTEPDNLPKDHPLFKMQNVIITPHIATYTESTFLKVFSTAMDNLKAGIKGEELPYPV